MQKSQPLLASLVLAVQLSATASTITVQVDKPAHPVSPTLWGIFFEDINLSADGGIYPELVRNRSFEDGEKLENWDFTSIEEGKSSATIATTDYSAKPPVVPLNPLNNRSLRLKLNGAATLSNGGYWGMNIVKGDGYTLKLAARAADGFNGPLAVKVLAGDKELAVGEIRGVTGDWKYYTLDLTATDSDPKATLQINLTGKGTLFLDMVSLMPKKSWKNHGLRPDLMNVLDGMKPSFLRFPGGCWVEGETMARMYDWKKTVGNVDVRTPLYNIWGYYATHGVGYHEYLVMCEDLGAEPLFDINCGMSHKENVPMDMMDQWVQDALDAIEYANGPTNTVWGGLRARNGHPAPFNLKYLEIGNENGGSAYNERWPLFVNAIKAKYPEVQLIANDWQNNIPKHPKPEIVDEHYYDTPEWFLRNAGKYDNYDRKGPKIFVGEYAVTKNTGLGNLRGAIGEAAFMTGIERNSDIVTMACYAPLFVSTDYRDYRTKTRQFVWNPNLINFDSANWYGLPSYYVQKLFSEHRGDVVLPTTVETTDEQEPLPTGGIGVGTWNTAAEFKDIKVTAPGGKMLLTSDFTANSDGWKKLGDGKWAVKDGAFQQNEAGREFVRALAGDKSWTDYTLELKARKISGREGFLIMFHVGDDEDRIWWNLGGWENTAHAIELGETMDRKQGRIETGRWYDIKVEVKGTSIKCTLDGKVVHDIKNARASMKGLFASATRETKSGDIIVKVVNGAATPTETTIALNGAGKLSASAQAIVLTSENAKDENTLENPTKVSPKTETLKISGNKFTRSFPGNSFTILRIPAGK